MTLRSIALLASKMEELRRYRAYKATVRRGLGFGWKMRFPFYRNIIRHEAQKSWPGGYIPVAKDLLMYIPEKIDAAAGYLLLKPYEHDPLATMLCKLGETVIDVGANLGRWTAPAALAVGQTGRVIAIEPISRLATAISKTCLLNKFHWVTVINAAASDKEGEEIFSVEKENSGGSRLGKMQDDRTRSFHHVTLKTITIDRCVESEKLETLELMKIDVEGYENRVIAGAVETLRRFSPCLVIETGLENSEARAHMASMLRRLNYAIVGVPAGKAWLEGSWDDYLNIRGPFNRPNPFDIILMVPK
jgi:FkbM family methyltransferase